MSSSPGAPDVPLGALAETLSAIRARAATLASLRTPPAVVTAPRPTGVRADRGLRETAPARVEARTAVRRATALAEKGAAARALARAGRATPGVRAAVVDREPEVRSGMDLGPPAMVSVVLRHAGGALTTAAEDLVPAPTAAMAAPRIASDETTARVRGTTARVEETAPPSDRTSMRRTFPMR